MKAQGGWCGICLEWSPGGTVDWEAHSTVAAGPACPGGCPRAGVSQGTAVWLRDLARLCPSSQLWGRDQIKSRRADVLKLWKTRGKKKTSGPSWNTRCNSSMPPAPESLQGTSCTSCCRGVLRTTPFLIQEVDSEDNPRRFPQILSDQRLQEAGPERCSAARVPPCQARRSAEDWAVGTRGRGLAHSCLHHTQDFRPAPIQECKWIHVKAAAVPMSLLRRGTEPSPCSSARVLHGPPWGKSPGILTALTLAHSDISRLG